MGSPLGMGGMGGIELCRIPHGKLVSQVQILPLVRGSFYPEHGEV